MTYNNNVYKWTCRCGYIAKTRRELFQHRKEFQCGKKYGQTNIEWTCKFCGCERFSPKYAKTHHEKYCKDNPDRAILKISEGMKKAHAEGRANEWQGRRERSYAEQSWYNIFANDLGEKTFINNYFVKKYWLDFAWPDKKIYFEVDGRTHFTEEGLKHDLERTEFLKKEGWDLIGRCNWSEYQKLSREEKEKYVQEIEQKIKGVSC